jgi:hypothetical protein
MPARRKLFLFQLLVLVIALAGIEVALRLMGYQPGDMKPNWLNFATVDTLVVSDLFYTNAEGILVANRNDSSHTEYINSDGFRSKEFSSLDSGKKKVLFIGDSFTWGFSAKPISGNCFADIVANETNYEVINLGVPGADPPQYARLAEKYIPQFKPDFVFVMFYMSNDLMNYDRIPGPHKAVHYFTNAGVIYADIDGKHFDNAQAAYNYVSGNKYYLSQPSNIFEQVIAKSALLSRLYSVRFRIMEKKRYEDTVKDTRITKKYLKAIKNVADQYKVPVRFILIPEIKEADQDVKTYKEKYANLLLDSTLKDFWLIPQNQKAFFTEYPDGHLNNKGHRHYGNYIMGVLKKNGSHAKF